MDLSLDLSFGMTKTIKNLTEILAFTVHSVVELPQDLRSGTRANS